MPEREPQGLTVVVKIALDWRFLIAVARLTRLVRVLLGATGCYCLLLNRSCSLLREPRHSSWTYLLPGLRLKLE